MFGAGGGETDLYAGHLEGVDGVGYALLELVLDGGRAEEEHVALDDLGGLVEGVAAAVDGGSSLVVDGRPLLVLGLWDVAVGDAERAQALGRVILGEGTSAVGAPSGGRWGLSPRGARGSFRCRAGPC